MAQNQHSKILPQRHAAGTRIQRHGQNDRTNFYFLVRVDGFLNLKCAVMNIMMH